MKGIKFILAVLFLIVHLPCRAQYEEYCKVGNNTFVTTNVNAELYELPYAYTYDLINGKSPYMPRVRDYIDAEGFKVKRIKNPQQLRVIRYTNTRKQQDFNAYVVEYKEKYWVLHNYDVEDNSLMNKRSGQLLSIKTDLETKCQILNRELDSLVISYTKECTDSLNYYRALKTQLPQIRDSLENVVKTKYQQQRDKVFGEWQTKQTSSVRRAASIIQIDEARLESPNSAGGCDYHLYFTNLSSKTIKYLRWSGQAYNRVNDPAYCEIRGSASCSGYYTGPIRPEEERWGCWDCVVYNYDADTIKLNNISIEYMDGSYFNLSASDIRALVNTSIHSRLKEIDGEEQKSLRIISNSVMTAKSCDYTIKLWEGRLNLLNNRVFYSSATYQYGDTFKSLKQLELDINKHHKQIELFDKFINFEQY